MRIVGVNALAAPAFAHVPDVIGKEWPTFLREYWSPDAAEEVIEIITKTLSTGTPFSSIGFRAARVNSAREENYNWEVHRISLVFTAQPAMQPRHPPPEREASEDHRDKQHGAQNRGGSEEASDEGHSHQPFAKAQERHRQQRSRHDGASAARFPLWKNQGGHLPNKQPRTPFRERLLVRIVSAYP